MRGFNYVVLAAAAGIVLGIAPQLHAQISARVPVGPAPVCPYGYYDYAPYNCAPDGYYGPDWFPQGRFIGAGPWFRGPMHFSGHVNNHLDPRSGYQGPLPVHGPAQVNPDRFNSFQGNELRDGQGHIRPPEQTGR